MKPIELMKDYILSLLKSGSKEKPISRFEIRLKTKLKDRVIRNYIGALRDEGHRVIGTSDENGYWIARTEEEYKEFRRNYTSKAATIMRRANAMDNYCEGQVEL